MLHDTHMNKGPLDQSTSDVKLGESSVIARLKNREQCKFLGVHENLKQDDKLVLKCAAEVYLKRISVIRSSLLSCRLQQGHSHKPVCAAGTGLLRTHPLQLCNSWTDRHERSWWRMAESTHWGQRRCCNFRER